MAKPHWQLPDTTHGCQNTNCTNPATWQWQRHMTPQEITTSQTLPGPYGTVHHGTGPHHQTVFACNQHTPQNTQHQTDLQQIAKTHKTDCPAPDPGCEC